MKTVHAWFKEVDAAKIADEYFREYPIEYENFRRLKKTVAEIKEAYRLRLLEFWKCCASWKWIQRHKIRSFLSQDL